MSERPKVGESIPEWLGTGHPGGLVFAGQSSGYFLDGCSAVSGQEGGCQWRLEPDSGER